MSLPWYTIYNILIYIIKVIIELSHFQHVLQEKLKYAIHFCKSIDTDEYARVAMAGDLAVSSSSDAESDPEMDSIASH